jgi:hypothetical protein
MRISDLIARTITQRRALVWSGVVVVTIACIAILVTSLRLDSEVFNVLPARYSSVQGLKIYDRDFEQTSRADVALVVIRTTSKTEDFAPMFAERLRQQPWCGRVLGGSPMATPEGIRDSTDGGAAVAKSEPTIFDQAISIRNRKIRDRLHACGNKQRLPKMEFELSFDPLGLIAPASSLCKATIEQEQPLTSPDEQCEFFW